MDVSLHPRWFVAWLFVDNSDRMVWMDTLLTRFTPHAHTHARTSFTHTLTDCYTPHSLVSYGVAIVLVVVVVLTCLRWCTLFLCLVVFP